MLSKTSKKKAAVTLPSIPKAVIDRMVSGPMTAEAINATSMAFKKALIERALGAELSHHLGFLPGTDKPVGSANHRGKTVLTDDGPRRIDVPRDRSGSFEPLLIPKHERRFTGFDDKIVALYARGMTRREIQGVLVEQYGTEVSPELIRSVTDAVMAEVTVWQVRPWEPMSPVVFFDCLRVKIREDAVVHNKAIDLALGILPDGTRDILGLWIENTEGQVLDEGLQRPQDPWRGRHPDCRHGRSERHGRGARCFRRRRGKPASWLSSATASTTPVGRTARHWRQRSSRSTPRRAPKRRRPSWTALRQARGESNSRLSPPRGAASGIG